jgi:hypothetical protein
MKIPESDRGITSSLFLDLLAEFLEDSGFELHYHGRKVQTLVEHKAYFHKLFLFLISVVAAGKRLTYSPLFEMEFVQSKRKAEVPILKLRPHVSVGKHFKANTDQVRWEGDRDYDSIRDHAYEVFNSIARTQRALVSKASLVTVPEQE